MTMHSFFAICSATTLAATMAVSAQTPSPTTGAPSQPSRDDQGGTITVVGCLRPYDSSMGSLPGGGTSGGTSAGAGSAGGAGATGGGMRYILTDVREGSRPSSGSTGGSTGSTASESSAATGTSAGSTPGRPSQAQPGPQRYVLEPGSGVNLSNYVNQTVQVVGTRAKSDMSDRSSPRTGETNPGSTATGAGASLSMLNANSVTMVNATCASK